ncbi:hypothetical protein CEXT_702971 [Caerostris extrusa]|uniref:Uncharacterized protein n=1 Tax=Caerostris extrusa TaxID=172846 RepID=A0AAV4WDY5_CAEEX|nr:hypothetical protein CEXT_702971 [Caerostris extrusa]
MVYTHLWFYTQHGHIKPCPCPRINICPYIKWSGKFVDLNFFSCEIEEVEDSADFQMSLLEIPSIYFPSSPMQDEFGIGELNGDLTMKQTQRRFIGDIFGTADGRDSSDNWSELPSGSNDRYLNSIQCLGFPGIRTLHNTQSAIWQDSDTCCELAFYGILTHD